MFDNVDAWLGEARSVMARYVAVRHQIDELETQAAILLADVVEAYHWPEELPEPERTDTYRARHIDGEPFGEDLTGELAVVHRCSDTAAMYMVRDVTRLLTRLPGCWDKVSSGAAPLWQARQVAEACSPLARVAWNTIDASVAPGLGSVGPRSLHTLIDAAVKAADPEMALRVSATSASRCVRMGGDKLDPLTGWVSARLDRADVIFLDATVQRIADQLAAEGNTGSEDARRSTALGMLANPAAVVQYVGVHTTRGMDPVPGTEEDKHVFVEYVKSLVPAFTPRVQLYVHLTGFPFLGTNGLARVEQYGPILTKQVARLTQGCHIRVTPVIHTGTDEVSVNAYEITARMREDVIVRDLLERFPWSSLEARTLDMDHTIPYDPDGPPDQTRPSNLAPLARRAHRWKTRGGWRTTQPTPGRIDWFTPVGQIAYVDCDGTHPVHDEE